MTKVYVQCRLKNGPLYEYHYTGERFCIAQNSKSADNRVCRAETGASNYTENAATHGNYYRY